MQSAAHSDNLCSGATAHAPNARALPTTPIKSIGQALAEEDELCAFLRDKARVSSGILKQVRDKLREAEVEEVEDLYHLRKVGLLSDVFKPLDDNGRPSGRYVHYPKTFEEAMSQFQDGVDDGDVGLEGAYDNHSDEDDSCSDCSVESAGSDA